MLEPLLAQGLSSRLLVHHLKEGLRHYQWNVENKSSEDAKHHLEKAIERLVRDEHLDATNEEYISEMKRSYGWVSDAVVLAYYERGLPADFLKSKIDEYGKELLSSTKRVRVDKSKQRLSVLLEHAPPRDAISAKVGLFEKLVAKPEHNDLAFKLLRNIPPKHRADLNYESLKPIFDAALKTHLKSVAGESSNDVPGNAQVEEFKFLLKESAVHIQPDQLDRILRIEDMEVRRLVLKDISNEVLLDRQWKLFEMLGDEGVRHLLSEKQFYFVEVDGQGSVLKAALKKYSESNISKDEVQFVIRHYRFSRSAEDAELLAQLFADGDLMQGVLVGEGYFDTAFLQGITEKFASALKVFRIEEALNLVGTNGGSDLHGVSHLLEPEEGFTQFVCDMSEVKKHPSTSMDAYRLLKLWMDSTDYNFDWDGVHECLERAIKRQRLGVVPLAGLLQLLRHYDVQLDSKMALHLQATVLNKAISFLSVDESQVNAVYSVFESMPWLKLKRENRNLIAGDERLFSVNEIFGGAFVGLENDVLLKAFARFVLPHYPIDLYDQFLSNIYKSGNTKLLAYVIAVPGHYQHMLKYKDSLFPKLESHLLDMEVKSVASLMLYSCIVPLGEVNDEVSAVRRQCDERRGHLLSKDSFSGQRGLLFFRA